VTKLNIPEDECFELLVWLPGKGSFRDTFKGCTVPEVMEVAKLRHAGCLVKIPLLAAKRPTPTRRRTQRNV
jgi:hypothetical protein